MNYREFDLKEIIEGAYYPGVYIIQVNKEFHEGISYEDFDERDWSTFIHEYVHFLQDISTNRGYLYFAHKAQIMNMCFYELFKHKGGSVALPIKSEECNVLNASEKELLLDFYEGDSYYKKIHHVNQIKMEKDNVVSELMNMSGCPKKDFFSIIISANDGKVKYQFGNICIAESMAYLIEKILFGAETRHNELPYNACEMLCKYYYPNLLKDSKRIAKLCEVALMFDDCGMSFYELILLCKEHDIANLTEKDFDEFCKKNLEKQFVIFDKSYVNAKNGVDVLFPDKFPYTYSTNRVLKKFLECGHNYRKGVGLFITKAFDAKDANNYFRYLISRMPFPVIIDKLGDYYGPEGAQNMPVADAVIDILTNRQTEGCKLQNFCKKSKIENFEKEVCTRKPWMQCKKNGACPVAIYFIGYSVDDINYTWNK